jgi:putative ABC transport system ATP-binding protein
MANSFALQVTDLTYTWKDQKKPTLEIPELNLDRGESLFIQGPSGSGKSTLLNLFSGVLSVQKGSIELLGSSFSTLNNEKRDEFRANHLGYIFQQFNLLPYLTVLENVLLPVKISKKRRGGNRINLPELKDEAEHWLSQLKVPRSLYHEKITRLSIGQQQRVAAARAMIGSPEIIIADEPTSALDQNNIDNFMSVLVEQCNLLGSSLIFVSHDQSLSSYFDKHFTLKAPTQENVE